MPDIDILKIMSTNINETFGFFKYKNHEMLMQIILRWLGNLSKINSDKHTL